RARRPPPASPRPRAGHLPLSRQRGRVAKGSLAPGLVGAGSKVDQRTVTHSARDSLIDHWPDALTEDSHLSGCWASDTSPSPFLRADGPMKDRAAAGEGSSPNVRLRPSGPI